MNIKITENIHIESLALPHAENIFYTIDSFRSELREWLPFVDYTNRVEDSIHFINYATTSGDIIFAIFHENNFTGLAGIKDIDDANKKAEIGYWISPAFQNKGIATTVSEFLIKYCFNELNLNRIQICIGVNNIKSNRVAEKLNLKLEGIQRDGELLVSGFHDLNVFSIIKREFNNKQNASN